MAFRYHPTVKKYLRLYPGYTITREIGTKWALRFHVAEIGRSFPITSERVPEYQEQIEGREIIE